MFASPIIIIITIIIPFTICYSSSIIKKRPWNIIWPVFKCWEFTPHSLWGNEFIDVDAFDVDVHIDCYQTDKLLLFKFDMAFSIEKSEERKWVVNCYSSFVLNSTRNKDFRRALPATKSVFYSFEDFIK